MFQSISTGCYELNNRLWGNIGSIIFLILFFQIFEISFSDLSKVSRATPGTS